jgi:hypothetical protein
MSDEKVIQFASHRTRAPEELFYDDLVSTIAGADVSQIVSLLAAAHDVDVLAAIATELGELVRNYREWKRLVGC